MVEDLQVHRAHFLTRLENEHGRRPDRYLAALEDIRSVQHYLTFQAERWNVPIVDASNLDGAIRRVLRHVVGSAMAPVESVAAIGAE